MVIEYAIELPCEPRRRLGADGLRDRLRRLQALRDRPGLSAAEREEVREATFTLRPLAFHCARCPANHAGRPFGCCGTITSPFSADAEEWLVERLPGTLETKEPAAGNGSHPETTEAVRALLEAVRAERVDGRPVDERYRKGPLLERPQAAVRSYGSLLRRRRLTSSQLLQLLFFASRVEPVTAERVCRALGVWEDHGHGADGVPEVVFTEPVLEDDDPSVAELKEFLLALIVACSLDLAVRTDVRDES